MKPVLILENSQNSLNVNESALKENKYIMEGIFTVFSVKNRNERIYDAQQFIPHLNELMERKKWGVIYGEYDHPDVFDVSMKNVSHVIENAWYNETENRVDGQIRLLSTRYGQDAKAIVNDGLPIFVSSRAAGVTESNGHVSLKKLFTWDIVADPGFPQAKMSIKSMNESLGFKQDSNFRIVEATKHNLSRLNEKYNQSTTAIFDLTDEIQTNQLFEMNKNDMITKKQFDDYSKHLISEIRKQKEELTQKINESKKSGNIENISEKIEYIDKLEEQFSKIEGYLDYLSEKVQTSIDKTLTLESKTEKIVEFTEHIAENVNENIKYSNYLSKSINEGISYSESLAKTLNESLNFQNYLAESINSNISYCEHIAENTKLLNDTQTVISEKINDSIKYSEFINEELVNSIKFQNYLAENLDLSISYSDSVNENTINLRKYTEYVAESADKTMEYSNMITEKINSGSLLNEKLLTPNEFLNCAKPKQEIISEKVETILENKKTTSLGNKIDDLITEAKKREASKVQKPSFYDFLTPQDIAAFEQMSVEDQEKTIVAINESTGYYSRQDVLKLIREANEVQAETIEQVLLKNMPKSLLPKWEQLTEDAKKKELNTHFLYNISTNESIQHFWTTRKFATTHNEDLKVLIDYNNPLLTNNKLNESQIDMYMEKFNKIN